MICKGTALTTLQPKKSYLTLINKDELQKEPSRGFLRKGALKICSKFTGQNPCESAISVKLLCNFTQITLWHGCSPVNLLYIWRTPFSKNTSRRLLLGFLEKKSNCCTIHKHNKAIFVMYPQQVSYTYSYIVVYKSK